MKIPFDSINLAAVVTEAQSLVGGRVQKIVGFGDLDVALGIYAGEERFLYLSADARFSRAHLLTRRPDYEETELTKFCGELRKFIRNGRVVFIRQRGLDRILEIGFASGEGDFQLIAELMGKHANLMLVNREAKVIAATKWVGGTKSKRPILPGKPYVPPPFEPKPSILKASEEDNLKEYEGASPFLQKLLAAGLPLEEAKRRIREQDWMPQYSPGNGAYPLPLSALGVETVPRDSISQALEQHFSDLAKTTWSTEQKANLRGQLERVALAREVALNGLNEALENAAQAAETQRRAELMLAYQAQIKPGMSEVEVYDYEGNPLTLTLDPELTAVENAEKLFKKAKHAKERQDEIQEQKKRMEAEHSAITDVLERLELADTPAAVAELRAEADQHRWLQHQTHAEKKEDRPYQGKRIRELLSPAGYKVLYGENSEANDYLTMRVAKPRDWWLHVRGAVSTHVVLQSGGNPDKVQKPDLLFAAKVAVRHSPSKHAGLVAVDYTQKRYVRKPKGSAPGFVTYTHEKTIHIDS
ncbi:MAG: Rqc2 family fibronectin-binding protein [Fimbriimonadaceae bacterium]